jgi:hypothetical protein
VAKFAQVANRVCGSGSVVNTIILHNDTGYGGAGYPNGATLTTNRQSFNIAVHEVGHSLFGLADEYPYSNIDAARSRNCDNAGCSKWQDLIGKFGVGCHQGYCTGGGYYASYPDTLMNYFGGRHFGAVNERAACCKYLSVGAEPSFCAKFTGDGLNLHSYCSSTGSASLLTLDATNATAEMIRRADDTQGMIYRYRAKPIAFDVRQDPASQEWTCMPEGDPMEPGLYQQSEVEGDESVDAHLYGKVDDSDELLVVATHADGSISSIPYHKYDIFEVPADPNTNAPGGEVVRVPRKFFRIVFDNSSPVDTCEVRA